MARKKPSAKTRVELRVSLTVDTEAYADDPDIPDAVALEVQGILKRHEFYPDCRLRVTAKWEP